MAYQGFVNLTPFAAEPLLLSDERGGDALTCVVKATLLFRQHREGTALAVADEQVPVCVAPKYYGDPGASSLKYDAETALAKVGTDIALIGHAHTGTSGARYVDVSVAVGPARSVVRVFGNRVWTTVLGRWATSMPEPFDVMPLVYERAFGGWDRTSPNPAHHDYEPRNPVGIGFVSTKHATVREGFPLPNLENPYELIGSPTDRPTPACFGFIGPHWQDRRRYAGTYGEQWQKQRMPLLPHDFDRRFYSAAHPSLTLQGFLRGGEPVEVLNASARGPLRFWLPVFQPRMTVRLRDGATHHVETVLDTVVINTDEDRVFLVWRGSLALYKRVHDVVWAKAQLAA